jgi:hypothetical protein
MKIKGTFEVKLNPIGFSQEGIDGIQLGRMSIDKTFHGELSGQSKGEMLSAMTSTKGSAGYVALEQFVGTLNGKKGSFVLQHFGIMAQGDNRLILEVVPDSGAGELKGLSGTMQIIMEDGKHYYEFDYS